jgi:hypothetical protein
MARFGIVVGKVPSARPYDVVTYGGKALQRFAEKKEAIAFAKGVVESGKYPYLNIDRTVASVSRLKKVV